MKTLADGHEAVVVVPLVVGIVPVEVQVTLVVVLIENRDVDVTVRILPLGAEMYNLPSIPPSAEYSNGLNLI